MWKRILIVFIALFGTLSAGYAFYNVEMKASNQSYQVGGKITGRVNKAPAGINGSHIGMRKGDKLYLGLQNDDGTDFPFQLLYNINKYTQYTADGTYGSYSFPNLTPKTSWISGSLHPYGNKTTAFKDGAYTMYIPWNPAPYEHYGSYYMPDYTDSSTSIIYPKLKELNAQIDMLSYKDKLIGHRDLTNISKYYNFGNYAAKVIFDQTIKADEIGQHAYLLDLFELDYLSRNTVGTFNYPGLYGPDSAFIDNYWLFAFAGGSDLSTNGAYYVKGTDGSISSSGQTVNTTIVEMYVRPFLNIDTSNIIFATSIGTQNSIGKVEATTLPAGYTHIYNDTSSYDTMKIRLENNSLSATTTFTQIENKDHTEIDKVTKDTTVYINANAQSGNDGAGGIYTVSALVFDKDGNFKYYKPLESAKGNGLYAFDLTGIPAGKYKIGIVNEAYNENSTIPADSSSITDVRPLEIVEPLSDLSFTPQSDLQVNHNVNVGDKVGSISSKNGAGSPQYTLIEDSAYPGEADQLEIGSNKTSVVVKNSALHAGTYHFKIQAQDENGNPNPALEINASFTVNKTNLTVAFDDPNQTKKSIAQATAGWNETASATPSTGTKVTYSKVGGSVGIINLDPNTGTITYTGGSAYGKITIKATADDDASTGNDDYQATETTKEIVIFREVDGSVTPHTNSSSTSSPTFQTSDANIKPNGVIGKIVATLGTPNNGTSGATTYTYGLKQVDDYNYFSVNTSTGEIKTTADLSSNIGNYSITVTVSDQWSTKEIPVNISVGLSPAENLKFYENTTSNTIITTKSAALTDKNVTVFATVKGSSNNNPVTYRLKDGETTNVIDVNPNSGAITIKNVGTVVIVAEKQGASGQADAITELTFTVTAGSQQFIYTDASGNELPKSGNDYDDYSEVYGQGKTFQLYTSL